MNQGKLISVPMNPHGGESLQAAPQADNCFNVLFQDLFQVLFPVLFLGRLRFCFRALAWFCFWAVARKGKADEDYVEEHAFATLVASRQKESRRRTRGGRRRMRMRRKRRRRPVSLETSSQLWVPRRPGVRCSGRSLA